MTTTEHYDLDTDDTLGGNNASDYVISSQKALKNYIDSKSIFIAEYGVTTYSDIINAINAGKNVIVKDGSDPNVFYFHLVEKSFSYGVNSLYFININELTVSIATVNNGDVWSTTTYTAVNKSGDTMSGTLTNTASTAYKLTQSNYSVFLRNDDSYFNILLTNENDASGTWNNLRPLTINLSNGYLSTLTPVNSSNSTRVATTAFVRNTTHGEWVTGNHTIIEGVSLNGSSNLTYTLASYLPNDGYTYEVLVSGSVTSNANSQVDLQVSALQSYMNVAYARSVTSNTISGAGTSILLAKYNTTITVRRNAGYNGTANLYCRAYRRVSY